jgi:nucleoid-associated protein YgaU
VFSSGSRYLKVPDYLTADRDGRPVRVKQVRPRKQVAGSFQYQVRVGDRLDLLAFRFYRNSRKWWLICDANPDLLDPWRLLRPGTLLTIPPDQAE